MLFPLDLLALPAAPVARLARPDDPALAKTAVEFSAFFAMQVSRTTTGHRYGSTYELLADLAVLTPGSALPSRMHQRPKKACFGNARAVVRESRGRYLYAEGYAQGQWFPMHHGWVVRADDPTVVIDPTWDAPEKCSYLGVVFDTAWLFGHNRGRQESVLDDWTCRFQTLQHGLPTEALHH